MPADGSIESTYVKLEQREHVLKRPDTYIGSIQRDDENLWLLNADGTKMELRTISYVPGLYKIFDEILVNAADNKVRDPKGTTKIKVTINQASNEITVWNDGQGLPVQIHKQHKVYVPELVFGHLLTSSNYNDEEEKVTGGRNGFGAKLTNIFSTKFTVETCDGKQTYKQTWRKNMLEKGEPVITKSEGKKSYTQVTFTPDLFRFGMAKLEDDIVALFQKRTYDMAACAPDKLVVQYNGTDVPIRSFKEYIGLYPIEGDSVSAANMFETDDKRWLVCLLPSRDLGFQQVSFVNSIATIKGGRHVDYLADQVINAVKAKSKKKMDIKPAMVKQHLWVFVRSLIVNPAFDSQTKSTLTTIPKSFGSTCVIPPTKLTTIVNKIYDDIMAVAAAKSMKAMDAKSRGKRVLDIPKLEDANEAGRKRASECTLILTEGDSAKALAMSGLSVVGRDLFGVFPLRGKLLNVRDAPTKQIAENKELQNLMRILGLQMKKEYTSVAGLRYGHVMIMADQDHDGSHIKGLIINMFHKFWPSLLQLPGFLVEFVTPIVKVAKKGRGENAPQSFFSMPEYLKWYEANRDQLKHYDIRYYKGLGTSKPEEGKEYFGNLRTHKIDFEYTPTRDDPKVLLAFDKTKADDRKAWLGRHVAGTHVDHTKRKLSVEEFVDKELILFSIADCERSIACVVDGFKPSQRKVLFGCFLRKLKAAIRVAQLTGYIGEHTAYHHGEASLQGTIVAMAQDFVGSNNINLLLPEGQFGTRFTGGKDAAQPRYIMTKLSPIARALFPLLDDNVLEYRDDDGMSVEPFNYVPILPMVLVNGCEGIGTGYATSVPQFNPLELVECVKALLRGADMPDIKPWYRGHRGAVTTEGNGKFVSHGAARRVNDYVVNITELPVAVWTSKYKEDFLAPLVQREILDDFREHHKDPHVDFEIMADKTILDEWSAAGLEEKFKLRAPLHTSNMVLFDPEGRLVRYNSPHDIIKEFFRVRIDTYKKRKQFLVDQLGTLVDRLSNMVRFVREVVDNTLIVARKKRVELVGELKARNYKEFKSEGKRKVAKAAITADEMGKEEGDDDMDEDGIVLPKEKADAAESTSGYDYLLGMKLWSLTMERIAQLEKQLADKRRELDTLIKTSEGEMYLADLDNFVKVQMEVEKAREEALKKHTRVPARPVKRLSESTKQPKMSDKGAKALAEVGKGGRIKTEKDAKDKGVKRARETKPKAEKGEAKGRGKAKDEDTEDRVKPTLKPRAKAAAKKETPKKAAGAAAKPKAKAARKTKGKKGGESDDDAMSLDESSASESSTESASEKTPPRTRRTRPAIDYEEVSESESESEPDEGSSDEDWAPSKKRRRK